MTSFRLLTLFLVVHVAIAQPNGQQTRFVRLYQLFLENGRYPATIMGKPISESLYSDIIVIGGMQELVDTLFSLSHRDLCDENGWGKSVGKCYDGYGLELYGKEGFTYWMVKRNGPASDGQLVEWNRKKKRFEFIYSP